MRALLALAAASALMGPQVKPRFRAVDVYVDAGEHPLAAWQIELVADLAHSRIVGVEEGDAPFDGTPPYYDPAALQGGRIILASFTTAEDPPAGRVRVARVHLLETRSVDYSSRLVTAAAPGAGRIEAVIDIVPAGEEK